MGWWGRARAVAATGWRNATVDIVRVFVPRHRSLRRPPPDIHVRYREGTGIRLRAMSSTHGANALADFTDRLAWAGAGDGTWSSSSRTARAAPGPTRCRRTR